MDAPGWRETIPPEGAASFFGGGITTPVEITLLRGQLHGALVRRGLPPGAEEDDIQRLLLAFEELTSNGLRHGRPPVRVSVAQSEQGWLIQVTDAAPEVTPTPAVDRDPAHGGLGLFLVARLSAAHGWWTTTGRKHVWACIRPSPTA